ncbi:alpha-ketoglutarate-dependent dioxygenase AlkB family protein [Lysobacter sp. GCM10012299]|uniref:alpha-ketoglutarate-dependent dioxygenase AlkB family protein n=1 Tax=Lysobacter sp. GCM10012299 TaxID=3317333 RepID=UPI00360772FA
MPRASAQPELFASGPRTLINDAEGGVRYWPQFIDDDLADRWFAILRESVEWQAQQRPMYDRIVDVPRLVAGYRLDDSVLEDSVLPAPLAEAAERLRAHLSAPFNSVGLNYYRDGNDSVAPHNDKLHGLAPGEPIALLSLGAPRRMAIRAKVPPARSVHIDLEPGSLLVMSHASQLHYLHGIAKTREPVGPRISLAYRVRPPSPH